VLTSFAMIAFVGLCHAALKQTRIDGTTFACGPALKRWAILNPKK
jgi:hypothetical protein